MLINRSRLRSSKLWSMMAERARVARPEGFEPSTVALEVRCSIQLSYGRLRQEV